MTAAIDGSRARCQSCGDPVLWVKTEARGQSMPLDPEPHPEGNVVMIDVPQTRHQVARVMKPAALPVEGEAYRSHFVTCRNHRRRPQRQKTFEKACAWCSWTIAGVTLKSVERAFDQHFNSEHLDTCRGCGLKLIWIRAESDMRILALDPEPVDDGAFIFHPTVSQTVAREAEPGSRGLIPHQCPMRSNVDQA